MNKSKQEDEDVYTAERIVKSRKVKNKVFYLIKWKGWSEDENTWEPEDHILNDELIKAFEKKNRMQAPVRSKKQVVKRTVQNDAKKRKRIVDDDDEEIRTSGDEDVYTAERIVKSRKVKNQSQYLVKWRNWGEQYNTWEPKENILDKKLIETFEQKEGQKKALRRSIKSTINHLQVLITTYDNLYTNIDEQIVDYK